MFTYKRKTLKSIQYVTFHIFLYIDMHILYVSKLMQTDVFNVKLIEFKQPPINQS